MLQNYRKISNEASNLPSVLSKEVRQVGSKLFLAREHEEFRQTWLYLILLAQLRVPVRSDCRGAEDLLEKMVEQRNYRANLHEPKSAGTKPALGRRDKATVPRNASREVQVILDRRCPLSPRDPSKDHERHHMLREYQSPQNVAPQQSYSCYAKRKQQQIVQTSA